MGSNRRLEKFPNIQHKDVLKTQATVLSKLEAKGKDATAVDIVKAVFEHQIAIADETYNFDPKQIKYSRFADLVAALVKKEMQVELSEQNKQLSDSFSQIAEDQLKDIIADQLKSNNVTFTNDDVERIANAVKEESSNDVLKDLLQSQTSDLLKAGEKLANDIGSEKPMLTAISNVLSDKKTVDKTVEAFSKNKTLKNINKQVDAFMKKQTQMSMSFTKSFMKVNTTIASSLDKYRDANTGKISALGKTIAGAKMLAGAKGFELDFKKMIFTKMPLKFKLAMTALAGIQKVMQLGFKVISAPFKIVFKSLKAITKAVWDIGKKVVSHAFFNFIKTPLGAYSLGWLIGYVWGKLKKFWEYAKTQMLSDISNWLMDFLKNNWGKLLAGLGATIGTTMGLKALAGLPAAIGGWLGKKIKDKIFGNKEAKPRINKRAQNRITNAAKNARNSRLSSEKSRQVYNSKKTELDNLEKQRDELQTRNRRLQKELGKAQRDARRHIKGANARIKQIEAKLNETNAKLVEADKLAKAKSSEVAKIKSEFDAAQSKYEVDRSKWKNEFEKAKSAASKENAKLQQEKAATEAQQRAAAEAQQRATAEAQKSIASVNAEKARIESQLESSRKRASRLQDAVGSRANAIDKFNGQKTELVKIQQAQNATIKNLNAEQKKISQLEQQLERLNAQQQQNIKTLENASKPTSTKPVAPTANAQRTPTKLKAGIKGGAAVLGLAAADIGLGYGAQYAESHGHHTLANVAKGAQTGIHIGLGAAVGHSLLKNVTSGGLSLKPSSIGTMSKGMGALSLAAGGYGLYKDLTGKRTRFNLMSGQYEEVNSYDDSSSEEKSLAWTKFASSALAFGGPAGWAAQYVANTATGKAEKLYEALNELDDLTNEASFKQMDAINNAKANQRDLSQFNALELESIVKRYKSIKHNIASNDKNSLDFAAGKAEGFNAKDLAENANMLTAQMQELKAKVKGGLNDSIVKKIEEQLSAMPKEQLEQMRQDAKERALREQAAQKERAEIQKLIKEQPGFKQTMSTLSTVKQDINNGFSILASKFDMLASFIAQNHPLTEAIE